MIVTIFTALSIGALAYGVCQTGIAIERLQRRIFDLEVRVAQLSALSRASEALAAQLSASVRARGDR